MKPLQVFMTVGSQMPFDRMTAAVADWARRQGPGLTVIAQVGQTRLRAPDLMPLRWAQTLPPRDYADTCRGSDLMVAHAGMGSVLTALELARPLLVLPRRGRHQETRNDHQVDTALHLRGQGVMCGGLPVQVALHEEEIGPMLDQVLNTLVDPRRGPSIPAQVEPAVGPFCSTRSTSHQKLIDHLRHQIQALGGPKGRL